MPNIQNTENAVYRPKRLSLAVTVALVLLFNPSINVVDVLPDFIAYFILARLFDGPSLAVPYFEEAKRAFIKLGFINLAKIPALFIIAAVRSKNTMDNDVVALASLVFAALEIIYLIPAVKNTFDALFYLGERSDAESLIKGTSLFSTEALKTFTLVFTVLKCILYCTPEFFRLTRSIDDSGSTVTVISGSRIYPFAILAAILIGLVVGSVWLTRMIKYVKSIKAEGKFVDAVNSLIEGSSKEEFEKRVKIKGIGKAFLIFNIASILAFDLTFSNFSDINLLPSVIFGILFSLGIMTLSRYTDEPKAKSRAIAVGIIYGAVSLIQYVLSVIFLTEHGYDALIEIKNVAAMSAYRRVELAASVEAVVYVAMCFLFYKTATAFISKNLGHGDKYGSGGAHDEYYSEINKRTITYTVITALSGLVALVNVFINGSVKLIFTNPSDITMPSLVVSSAPWFNLVVTAVSVIQIFYSIYYFGYIKEELE